MWRSFAEIFRCEYMKSFNLPGGVAAILSTGVEFSWGIGLCIGVDRTGGWVALQYA